ncbi:hypothetical protein JCM10003_113 [Bacteroides pyogenes JCM 10003]|nr:hypothetical protein [Bacteroides pyogenes]GAE20751.1 hypothetical protein JCM10003_113 [Bacteroides pyogenes JCM 10003]SUV31928.1 Uncharacterised protein [Bacteroides pyogenes]
MDIVRNSIFSGGSSMKPPLDMFLRKPFPCLDTPLPAFSFFHCIDEILLCVLCTKIRVYFYMNNPYLL